VVSAKDIATRHNIPHSLLAKALQKLSRQDFIEPIQGPKGGYRLKVKLNMVTLTQFFELMEGPLGLMDCYFDSNCELIDSCNIRAPINQLNESMRTMFDNMTLNDVTN
jgi:Rrf2 family protein